MSDPSGHSIDPNPILQSQDNSSSLQSLHDDLDNIYRSYTIRDDDDNSSLDSQTNRPPIAHRTSRLIPAEALARFSQDNPLPVHISSHLSSIGDRDDTVAQSAPQTPQSGGSFDFISKKPTAMSNTSVNILDTPTIEKDLRGIVTPSPVAASTDALKSVSLSDDEAALTAHKANTADGWDDRGAAAKKVGDAAAGYQIIRRGVTDFAFGKQLGEGSYSTVVLATDKITSKKYAVKILDKRHIIKEKKVKYVNIEKHALNRLSNRMGIISLYFTFQDKDALYFVLDYASNGELLSLIKRYNTLNEDCTRYFGAQILDAIKYMHDNGIIHRDIKPENILLDDKMRIQITDFGTARLLEKKNDTSEEYPVDVRAKSFVGTAEYVSPELLESKYCGKPGDIWAFGCIVYQMIAGKPPFKAPNEYLTFQKITKLQYAFSAGFPNVIRDLIKQILVLQPSKRATIPTIQNHYYFQSINFDSFDAVWNGVPPELGPYKMSAKSMMKIPEKNSKTPPTPSQAVKRTAPAPKKPVTTAQDLKQNGKNMNPASVAAYVLNKKENTSDVSLNEISADITDQSIEESPKLVKSVSRTSNPPSTARSPGPQPEYIPGTNILRPSINSMQSYSRSSSNVRRRTGTRTFEKLRPRVMDVTPLTPLEVAWSSHLKHSDERILKIGPVIAGKTATDAFERRYRGLLHDSPLGFQNRKKQSTSFLSQVVNGNNSGLRGGSKISADLTDEEGGEDKAIKDFFVVEEAPPPSAEPEASTGSKLSKSSFFKKLGLSTDKKVEPELVHPLDKAKTCTMLVTTHGRVLIFFRNDPDANYRLITEIALNYSFINFKEVVLPTSGKFNKQVPTTGIFAIESTTSTFYFEVEKHDLTGWTEALASAQTNQYERQKHEKDERSNSGNSKTAESPKLLESPEFTTHKPSSPPPLVSKKTDTSRRIVSDSKVVSGSKDGILSSRIKSRSVRRKPPPVSPPPGGIDMSTGLSSTLHDHGQSDMLHAAQLAVSNNPQPVVQKRANGSTTVKKTTTKGPQAINSMNSKFLARSQRKK